MENSNVKSFSFKAANPFSQEEIKAESQSQGQGQESKSSQKQEVDIKVNISNNIKDNDKDMDKENNDSEEYFSTIKDSPKFCQCKHSVSEETNSKSHSNTNKKHVCHLVEHEGARKSHFEYLKLIKDKNNLLDIPDTNISKEFTLEDISKHNTSNDLWLALNDKVYNVSKYLSYHPGGESVLLEAAGTDATDLFHQNHPWVNIKNLIGKFQVGILKK